MSRRLAEHVVDDLTGVTLSSDDHTVVDLTYGAKRYLIDLSATNAAQLDQTLQPYLATARQVPLLTGSDEPPDSALLRRQRNAAIRRWAAANGHQIPSRGRMPDWIREAYDQR